MRLLPILGAFTLAALASAETKPTPPTFSKDVAPILQARCQTCHRPGEAAPMSLLNYQEARPWAKAIKEAVLRKRMPPWFADSKVGHFQNDRSLSQAEIGTLVSWVDAGALEGNAKDLPVAKTFVTGWNIGEPELVLEMPQAFDVPVSGTVDYQYVILPQKFTEDRWVQAAEVRPGARGAVHHVLAFIREPGSKWMRDQAAGVVFVPAANEKGDRPSIYRRHSGGICSRGAGGSTGARAGASLVKAGSDIVFQLHYTANGKPAQDRSKVGVVFCKTPPVSRVMTMAAGNSKFTIPPGDANYGVKSQH